MITSRVWEGDGTGWTTKGIVRLCQYLWRGAISLSLGGKQMQPWLNINITMYTISQCAHSKYAS